MKNLSTQFKQTVKIIILAWFVSIGIIYIKAWIGPTSAPTTNKGAIAVDGSGNVGIGTSTPQNKLDVEGGAAIGATYSGANAAPTNGMIVEGNVGIGATSPSTKLEVNGAIKAAGIIESTSGGIKFPDATTQTTAGKSLTAWTCTRRDAYKTSSGV